MQFNPSQKYTLVRQLDNINDTGTYYVQAIIRFSDSGNIWQTVKLTAQAGQRFVGSFIAPPAGPNGVMIDITSFVYTDSGYSALSTTYATENDQHLVQPLFNQALGFGGGGSDISKKDVREVIKEELAKIKPNNELPKEVKDYFNLFSDILEDVQAKNEKFRLEMAENHKNRQSDLEYFTTHLKNKVEQLQLSLADATAENKEDIMGVVQEIFETLSDRMTNHINDKFNSFSSEHINRLDSMAEDIKSTTGRYFDTRINKEKRLRQTGIDKYIKNMVSGLNGVVTANFDEEEKELEPDYLTMAKKFIS